MNAAYSPQRRGDRIGKTSQMLSDHKYAIKINTLCEFCVSAVSLSVCWEEKPKCGFH